MSTNTNSLVLDDIEEFEPEKHAQIVRLVERTLNDENDSAKNREAISISGKITVSF